ncbi:MAG: glutamate--tRNA ligase family protein [Kiritimatiellia bacterium]|nr:glutamate--tRNA ligase family protein [Kiritimatiellia bacterium]
MKVRVRFAPSPTGQVHIGNMRAAIYNWLFARHVGGEFLLRIEDTDRERSTPEAVRTVLDAMEWLGLTMDEPPLYQSSRLAAHLAAAEDLVARGLAYRSDKGGTGKGEAILFRMPGTDMSFHDEIKGDLVKPAADLKDFVIVRSDGNPVFHLANVVDDIEMKISHVIRGDDHIENTYRHVALFRGLGAEIPKYAHLPMIVNAQGKPYSKRDGDAYVGEFKEKGFLGEAVFNFLVLLGWSPGDGREVLSRQEMIASFDLSRVRSAPSQFDPVKLHWMNGEHMRRLPPGECEAGCLADLRAHGLLRAGEPEDYALRVLAVMGDRIKRFSETAEQTVYFFTENFPWDEKAVRKRLGREGALGHLAALREKLAQVESFEPAALEAALHEVAESRTVALGELVHPVRVAVSGRAIGPGLFDLLATLGRDRVLARIDRAPGQVTAPPGT